MKINNCIIALLTVLLASCNSWQDEELTLNHDEIGINFTLLMNAVGASSRSLSSETIENYENSIKPESIKVLAYTEDGKAHEVTIITMTPRSVANEATIIYDIYGKLEGIHSITKIVVLANCGSTVDLNAPLNSLLYIYDDQMFNPQSPTANIPMWGELTVSKALPPGATTQLGKISLIRAMAKVSIKSTGNENLTKVTLERANNSGNCVPNPSNVSGVLVTAPTIPGAAVKNESVTFYQVNDKEMVAYLPEQSKNDQLEMKLTLGGKEYSLAFKDYTQSNQQPYNDVLRNTHYVYNVSVKQDATLGFNVVYKVAEWGTETICIGFE